MRKHTRNPEPRGPRQRTRANTLQPYSAGGVYVISTKTGNILSGPWLSEASARAGGFGNRKDTVLVHHEYRGHEIGREGQFGRRNPFTSTSASFLGGRPTDWRNRAEAKPYFPLLSGNPKDYASAREVAEMYGHDVIGGPFVFHANGTHSTRNGYQRCADGRYERVDAAAAEAQAMSIARENIKKRAAKKNPMSYGAPMGYRTRAASPTTTDVIRVRRVKIDRGGYAPDGAYFGIGKPVYTAESETSGDLLETLRAYDHASAKEKVRAKYPHAKVK